MYKLTGFRQVPVSLALDSTSLQHGLWFSSSRTRKFEPPTFRACVSIPPIFNFTPINSKYSLQFFFVPLSKGAALLGHNEGLFSFFLRSLSFVSSHLMEDANVLRKVVNLGLEI